LRLLRLGQANLWWDEALAIWAVRKGLIGVTLWTASDVHPSLYFWSLWAWVKLFGESPFAMRSISALTGVLAVAVTYALGKLAGGRRVGWLAALLMAGARFHIWWSQEMRMYVLAGLCCALSLYAFLRWLQVLDAPSEAPTRPPKPHRWLGLWVLASAAAMYTIFLSGAILIVVNALMLVALLWRRGDRRRLLLPWVTAQVAVGLLVGLWLIVSWGRMPTWSTAEPLSPGAFFRLYVTLLSTGISVYVERYYALALLPFGIAVAGSVALAMDWRHRLQKHRHTLLTWLGLWLTVLLCGAAIYISTLPRGLFYTPHVEARYFAPFAFAFYILLAWGLAALWQRSRLVGGTCLAVVLAIWIGLLPGYYQGRHVQDYVQTMVRAILSQAQPGDVVLLDSGSRYPVFLYDYERLARGAWRPPMRTISMSEARLTQPQVEQTLSELASDHERIWLAEVEVHLSDPDRLVASWLEANLQRTQKLEYAHNALYLYDREGLPPTLNLGNYPAQHPLDTPFGGGQLTGWELPLRTAIPGMRLHVALLWESAPDQPVSVALVNAQGYSLARGRLPAAQSEGAARQQWDLLIEDPFPNGAYQLRLESPSEAGIKLGDIIVAQASGWPQPTGAQVQQPARFGQAIQLEGYTVHLPKRDVLGSLRPGHTLAVDLYWQALEAPTEDYVVFVHLLGDGYNPRTQGPLWAGHDGPPANGHAPTSAWMAGETLVDRHMLTVDGAAPAGEYWLEVGLYRAATGERVALAGPQGESLGDHLLLQTPIRVSR
jgi:4-amino-4-deoxy-L-arabinose transferase-like glycosyltransferase